jgi:FKBP-type peptidyl-prolyl cis-trans isomerase FklB
MRRPRPSQGAPLLSLPLSALLFGCAPESPPPSPETHDERNSYAIGLHLGTRLRMMRAEVDPEQIAGGVAAGTRIGDDVNRDLDAGQIQVELARLATEAEAVTPAERTETARHRRAGMDFLARNRTRPGVLELPSGVQYRVLAAGDGAPPTLADRITVEYEGRLLDGAVFDTSKDRFAPTIVRLARTPEAWREVLPLVSGGALVEIWVPGRLEAAEHSVGLVPPGELVVFTLRVTAIDRHHNPDAARAPP